MTNLDLALGALACVGTGWLLGMWCAARALMHDEAKFLRELEARLYPRQ